MDEATTPCAPSTLYGVAKDCLRRLLQASPDGVSLAWGRVFFLYGPHEPPTRLVPNVMRSLLNGREALCGTAVVERDFMHVADVAAALVTLLESDVVGPGNIASGECLLLRDVIDRIACQIGRPDLVRLGARPTPHLNRLASQPQLIAYGTKSVSVPHAPWMKASPKQSDGGDVAD